MVLDNHWISNDVDLMMMMMKLKEHLLHRLLTLRLLKKDHHEFQLLEHRIYDYLKNEFLEDLNKEVER